MADRTVKIKQSQLLYSTMSHLTAAAPKGETIQTQKALNVIIKVELLHHLSTLNCCGAVEATI